MSADIILAIGEAKIVGDTARISVHSSFPTLTRHGKKDVGIRDILHRFIAMHAGSVRLLRIAMAFLSVWWLGCQSYDSLAGYLRGSAETHPGYWLQDLTVLAE